MHDLQHNPDVLSCLANLSSDEVFTPPEVANAMLDMLPQELWQDSKATFLDPACKSGVFLREIAKRLIEGLKDEIPDLQTRLDHIFQKQLYGIAITDLTALLSRRSLYGSKRANSKYSFSRFDTAEGLIRLNSTLHHTWKNGRCEFCGASQSEYDRSSTLESHAYEFIHTHSPEAIFNMKFDVIIGNPPYQLSDGGGNGASAKPIYHIFVQQAKKMNPRFIIMITPSRWFSGGKGLDDFRQSMLSDKRIRIIHDYLEASECFSGVQIKGGVSFFLWDRLYKGKCDVYSHINNTVSKMTRNLLEKGCNTFIRFNKAINILHKIHSVGEVSFSELVSSRMPFGLPNTFKGNRKKTLDTDVLVFVSGNESDVKGSVSFIPRDQIPKGDEIIDCHKVFIAKAGSGSDTFPHLILGKPFYGSPNTACNESYLVIGPFLNKKECLNVISYIASKFFRFLVLLKKGTQNAAKGVYQLVPIQDFSKPWTDAELYTKYGLDEEEIAFIESMIKPMDVEA